MVTVDFKLAKELIAFPNQEVELNKCDSVVLVKFVPFIVSELYIPLIYTTAGKNFVIKGVGCPCDANPIDS